MIFSWFQRLLHVSHPDANEAVLPVSSEAETQFQAGLRCACGEGVRQDYVQAAECYGRAAEQGHVLAQFNLAVMYAHGQGVVRDDARSMVLLTHAAEAGDPGAQYNLGVRQYLTCRDIKKAGASETRIEALKWVRRAAAQGYRGAENACEFVSFGMTMDQVKESSKRAGEPLQNARAV